MQHASRWFSLFLVGSLLVLFAFGCTEQPGGEAPDPDPVEEEPADTTTASIPPDFSSLCLNAPTMSSTVPGDTPLLSQAGINCFAWQEFIALNWLADPDHAGKPDTSATPAMYGAPGDVNPVVWETYMDVHQIFRDGGIPPRPWGTPPPVPDVCKAQVGDQQDKMRIMQASKVRTGFDAPVDLAQAFPFKNPNWLADRDGNLVWYEIVVSEDEYNYITTNSYYDANAQFQAVSTGKHVQLPSGVNGGVLGSIELKSAWLTVPDPSNAKWNRYKLTEAFIFDESANRCLEVTLALVGLHIIHKTTSQPQWTWATFEHIDNAPNIADVDSGSVGDQYYTFYNPQCEVKPVPSDCKKKMVDSTAVTQTSCEPNISPAYYIDPSSEQCLPYPIQVARLYPIPNSNDDPVQDLNGLAQRLIRQSNAASVWQYYQLVDVLWSDSPVNDNAPGTTPPPTPLSISGVTPSMSMRPVANTTMETYAQAFNCLHCHRNAKIAPSPGDSILTFASDYSFAIGMAKASGN